MEYSPVYRLKMWDMSDAQWKIIRTYPNEQMAQDCLAKIPNEFRQFYCIESADGREFRRTQLVDILIRSIMSHNATSFANEKVLRRSWQMFEAEWRELFAITHLDESPQNEDDFVRLWKNVEQRLVTKKD